MSTDQRVAADLIETLEDGRDGFASAADKLEASNRPELADEFRRFADQRAVFATELQTLAVAYGDPIDEEGSIDGTLNQAWTTVRETLSGSDPDGILDAAEEGEDHAVAEYERALANDHLSPDLRQTVQRQLVEVRGAHDRVRSLRDAA